ncbi:MAG: hypothetical protein ACI8Z5_002170 [Lentimonas sp.]|jgi:hypothetical protein
MCGEERNYSSERSRRKRESGKERFFGEYEPWDSHADECDHGDDVADV